MHVEVEDGLVDRVTIIAETLVRDPIVVEGDPAYLDDAERAAHAAKPGRPGSSATSRPIPRSLRARPSAGLFSFQEPAMADGNPFELFRLPEAST